MGLKPVLVAVGAGLDGTSSGNFLGTGFEDEQELAGPSGQGDGENPGWGASAGSSLMVWQWLDPTDGSTKVIKATPLPPLPPPFIPVSCFSHGKADATLFPFARSGS